MTTMDQLQDFAHQLTQGPDNDILAEAFLEKVLARAEEILRQEESVAGPRGEARFDAVMARLQATEFHRPSRTRIPEDRVGGTTGAAVEQRHSKEVQRTIDQNERLLTEVGKVGAAAGLALTTGNPAAALPLLAVLGKRLLEAMSTENPAAAP